MNLFDRTLFYIVSLFAVRLPTPSRYSISDHEDVSVNFIHFSISEDVNENELFVILRRVNFNRYEGRIVSSQDRESEPGSIDLRWYKNPKIRIGRIYGPVEIRYEYPLRFLLYNALGLHRLKFWKQRRDQRIFNRNFRFTAERIRVMKSIISWQEEKLRETGDFTYGWEFSALDAFSSVYSDRIWAHEDKNYFLAKFLFVIDSLCHSGEMTKCGGTRYKLLGKSLETISKYEADASRHRDSVNHNWFIGTLTLVIAIATAYTSFFATK